MEEGLGKTGEQGRNSVDIEVCEDNKSDNRLFLKYDDDSRKWEHNISQNKDIIYLSVERIGVQNEYHINIQELYGIGVKEEFAFDFLSKNKNENLRDTDFVKGGCGLNLENQVDF